jgi:hypothetical protein
MRMSRSSPSLRVVKLKLSGELRLVRAQVCPHVYETLIVRHLVEVKSRESMQLRGWSPGPGRRVLRRPFAERGAAALAVAWALLWRGAARLDEATRGEAPLSEPLCCGARRWPSGPRRHIPASPSGSVRSYVRPRRGVPSYSLIELLNNTTTTLLFHHGRPLLIEAGSALPRQARGRRIGSPTLKGGPRRRRTQLPKGGRTRLVQAPRRGPVHAMHS